MTKKSSVDLKTIILSNLLSSLGTFIATYVYFIVTQDKLSLTFEDIRKSYFTSSKNHLVIMDIKIENSGNKEVEKVASIFKLKDGIVTKEIVVTPSSASIEYKLTQDSTKKEIRYDIPILNSGEYCNFSFLLENYNASDSLNLLNTDLRGKGVNGVNKSKAKNNGFYLTYWGLILLIISIISSAIISFLLSRRATKKLYEKLITNKYP